MTKLERVPSGNPSARWWAQRTNPLTMGLEYLKWLAAVVQLVVLGHGSATPPAPPVSRSTFPNEILRQVTDMIE